jgi:hypothetical protein
MGRPISLEDRRTTDLADAIANRIAPDATYFAAPISEVDSTARWRRAARLVGRRRGWKTRTGVTELCVWMADERSLDGCGPTTTDAEVTHQLERMIETALRNYD